MLEGSVYEGCQSVQGINCATATDKRILIREHPKELKVADVYLVFHNCLQLNRI